MKFWKNDLKFWNCIYFKLLIIISEYWDAIKKQKEKGKENLRKRQISEIMQELKEKKRKIQLEKQKEVVFTVENDLK